MNYVCGFYISTDLQQFVMIKKNKPEWMRGKYNGIGGKIEKIYTGKGDDFDSGSAIMEEEKPKVAMAREFEEETGVLTSAKDWHCFHIEQYKAGNFELQEKGAKVYYFVTIGKDCSKAISMTDEIVSAIGYEDVILSPDLFVFNIPFLLLITLTHIKNNTLLLLNPEGVNS